MKTNSEVTYIVLERGEEDFKLIREINAIFAVVGGRGIKDIARKYPTILELQQKLKKERIDS